MAKAKTRKLTIKKTDKLFEKSSKKIYDLFCDEIENLFINFYPEKNIKDSESKAYLQMFALRLFVEFHAKIQNSGEL